MQPFDLSPLPLALMYISLSFIWFNTPCHSLSTYLQFLSHILTFLCDYSLLITRFSQVKDNQLRLYITKKLYQHLNQEMYWFRENFIPTNLTFSQKTCEGHLKMELNKLRKLGTFAKLLQMLFEKTMTINVKPYFIILKLNLDPQSISTSEYGPPTLDRFIPPYSLVCFM